MFLCVVFLLLTFKFTQGYPDGYDWKLALNIHASDGHNFGYGADAWDHKIDVGTKANAFTADYKNYLVTLETANSIAIVRHQNGTCEAARVWEFLADGKTLYDYLDLDQTKRLVATKGNWTSSDISSTMVDKHKDPIFAVDGALVFNWVSAGDGTRIGNSKAYCSGNDLPAENVNSNSYMGLGNEQGARTDLGQGSAAWWFDLGIQACKIDRTYRVQGSDHGTRFVDGTFYGQYAVYVSDAAKTFPCRGMTLQTSMNDKISTDDWTSDFYRIAKHSNHKLNFQEFEFDKADYDKDGVLTLLEYSEARKDRRFDGTAHLNINADFDRIDKNGDNVLNYDEIEFDLSDTNRDGSLSLEEYYAARAENKIVETNQNSVRYLN